MCVRVFQDHRLYSPKHTHSPARAKSDPLPPLKTRHKPVACFFILWARSHLLRARSRARCFWGARLARCRAPWPLCSNAEPQELRHGGGSSAGLALLPSPFLELRAHSRRTRFLPEVNMRRGRGSAEPRSPLSPRILSLCLFSPRLLFSPFSPVFFHQQRRSQELHLAASRNRRGCGHRPQENSRYARTRPAHGKVIRASRRREKWSRKGSFFFPCSRATASPHGSPRLPRADHLHAPPPSPQHPHR